MKPVTPLEGELSFIVMYVWQSGPLLLPTDNMNAT